MQRTYSRQPIQTYAVQLNVNSVGNRSNMNTIGIVAVYVRVLFHRKSAAVESLQCKRSKCLKIEAKKLSDFKVKFFYNNNNKNNLF